MVARSFPLMEVDPEKYGKKGRFKA